MNRIIICEGSTDSILLQYFLRTVYHWEDTKESSPLRNKFKTFRKLKKGERTLCIGGSGGVSQIKVKFDVYFSVRTAAEQFVERQNILKIIPWEKYMTKTLKVSGTQILMNTV